MMDMHPEIAAYHASQTPEDRSICELLHAEISRVLPETESKCWHGHPVWFSDGNPLVGYSKLKTGLRLLFWSGRSFDEPGLTPEGKFMAADVRYQHVSDINTTDLQRWLEKSRDIQWDYKNLVKRKGQLLRLK